MQKTLRNTISAVTWAPAAVLGTVGRILHLTPAQAVSSTKGRAMSLSDALKGVTDNVVDTVVHYVPVSPTTGTPTPKVDLTEGDVGPPPPPPFQPLETLLQLLQSSVLKTFLHTDLSQPRVTCSQPWPQTSSLLCASHLMMESLVCESLEAQPSHFSSQRKGLAIGFQGTWSSRLCIRRTVAGPMSALSSCGEVGQD